MNKIKTAMILIRIQQAHPSISGWFPVDNNILPIEEYGNDWKLLVPDIDCNNPYILYKLFLTDEILSLMASETNKYANEKNAGVYHNTPRRHRKPWTDVTIGEIVRLPEIGLYWSKNPI